MFLLESALQANGLGMIRDARGTYHVGRPDALRAIGGTLRQFRSGEPLPPGNGAVIIPLQYIGAAEMASILRPMVTPDAIVRVDNLRNVLVMSGTRTQAEAWMDLVNTFDVDLLKGMSVGVFPLKYASVKEVEAALRVVSGGGGSAPGAVPGTPAGAAAAAAAGANQANAAPVTLGEGNPLFGALRIMPIERINSILVVTPRAAYLDEARRWIEKLDQPSDNGAEPQLFIYHVQNGNAKHLAGVLSGIFGGQAGGSVANSGWRPASVGRRPTRTAPLASATRPSTTASARQGSATRHLVAASAAAEVSAAAVASAAAEVSVGASAAAAASVRSRVTAATRTRRALSRERSAPTSVGSG